MPDEHDYTEDPDLFESDRTLGGAPIYAEETGPNKGQATPAVRAPCPHCGTIVVTGQTDQGALVAVEPSHQVYTLIWHSGARWPRLTPSRGYVAHLC